MSINPVIRVSSPPESTKAEGAFPAAIRIPQGRAAEEWKWKLQQQRRNGIKEGKKDEDEGLADDDETLRRTEQFHVQY